MRAKRVMVVLTAVMTSALVAPHAAHGQVGGGRAGARGGDPAAMQARQNERLFAGITLSATQQSQVDSIQAAGREAQQTARQQGGMRDPGTRQRMMARRQATLAAIRAVLTDEQQATFDRNLASMPAMGGGGRAPSGQRPPDPR